jgi:hypothetical protein
MVSTNTEPILHIYITHLLVVEEAIATTTTATTRHIIIIISHCFLFSNQSSSDIKNKTST